MSAGAIAERYAQALYELGDESGSLPTLSEKLREFSDTLQSSRQLRALLDNPALDWATRRGLIEGVAKKVGVPDLGIKGLLVMARRRRLSALSATVNRLTELADEKGGVLRASVTTASQMPDSYYQSLSSQLAQATKKKIVLERSVDPALVGGAIARLGDTLIDGSLRGRLQQVERELLAAVASGVSS